MPSTALAEEIGLNPELSAILDKWTAEPTATPAENAADAETSTLTPTEPEPGAETDRLPAPEEDAAPAADPEPETEPTVDEEEVPPVVADEKEEKQTKQLLKRIDKLTARAKSAEEELESLRAEREARAEGASPAARSSTPGAAESAANPLVNVWEPAALDEAVANAKSIKTWALKNWDGAVVRSDDGSEREYSAEQVREYFANADAIVTDHAPARRQYLQALARFDDAARGVYPELFSAEADEAKEAAKIAAQVPGIRNFPDWRLFVGDYQAGRKARLAKEAASAKGDAAPAAPSKEGAATSKPSAKPLAPLAPTGTPPARRPAAAAKRDDAITRLMKSNGTADDIEAVFAAAG
jgi:hypothetical protein